MPSARSGETFAEPSAAAATACSRSSMGFQSCTTARTSPSTCASSAASAWRSASLTMRSHSTRISDSIGALCSPCGVAAPVPSNWPWASRCTSNSGCTIQCAVRPLRFTAMVTESTRNGMSSCTIWIEVCSLTKPSSASVALNTRIFTSIGARGACSSRQCAFAMANSVAAPRERISSGSVFSK